MSKQAKHRYLNSFFLTSTIYLVASFFLFYVFADTLVVPEKKQEEVKTISLQHVALKQEPPKPEPTPPEPIVEPEIIPEPIVEMPKPIKKIEKPKEHVKHKKHEKPIEKPIEKVVEQKVEPVIAPVQETKPIEKTIEQPIKQVDTNQIQSIEDAYLSKIRSEIEKNKTYPKVAKRLNQTGKVYITFLVTKDGGIKNCRINKSSNFESLDEASLEVLMKIASFDAIPQELNKTSWEITVPIVYQLTRN